MSRAGFGRWPRSLALTLLVAAVGASSTALAQTPGAATPGAVPTAPASKKQALLADKQQRAQERTADADARDSARQRWQRQLDRRIGKPPDKLINIHNGWTDEFLAVPMTAGTTSPTVPADRVNDFLRCRFTNRTTEMDSRLIDTVIAAARHFDSQRVDVISGYRSEKHNLNLRKKGREVSRNSQHTKGNAVDFRLRGVSVERLHAWAKRQRLGGVGRYRKSGFIHMDTGRIRYWNGR